MEEEVGVYSVGNVGTCIYGSGLTAAVVAVVVVPVVPVWEGRDVTRRGVRHPPPTREGI